jgi:hypothetical protein
MCHPILVKVTFEPEGPLDGREDLVEYVAFDPRLRQDDVIYEIPGLENQGGWAASMSNVTRVWTQRGCAACPHGRFHLIYKSVTNLLVLLPN